MSVKTGIARLARVIRVFGIAVGMPWVIYGFWIIVNGDKFGSALTSFGIGALVYAMCWAIAYVVDGFAKDDER